MVIVYKGSFVSWQMACVHPPRLPTTTKTNKHNVIIKQENNNRRVYPPTILETNPSSNLFRIVNDQLSDLWSRGYSYEETKPTMMALYNVLPSIITRETLITTPAHPIELLKKLLDYLTKRPDVYSTLPLEWIMDNGLLFRTKVLIVLTESQIKAAIRHYCMRYPVQVEKLAMLWSEVHKKK